MPEPSEMVFGPRESAAENLLEGQRGGAEGIISDAEKLDECRMKLPYTIRQPEQCRTRRDSGGSTIRCPSPSQFHLSNAKSFFIFMANTL